MELRAARISERWKYKQNRPNTSGCEEGKDIGEQVLQICYYVVFGGLKYKCEYWRQQC